MKIKLATKQLQVENRGKIADLKVQVEELQTELLNGVLARRQLRGEDAQHADHGHAAVVELLAPHLWRVHLQAQGVAKVARLILQGLPPRQLQEPAGNEDRDEANHTLTRVHRAKGA